MQIDSGKTASEEGFVPHRVAAGPYTSATVGVYLFAFYF